MTKPTFGLHVNIRFSDIATLAVFTYRLVKILKAVTFFIESWESGKDNRKRFSSPNPIFSGLWGAEMGCKSDTEFGVWSAPA